MPVFGFAVDRIGNRINLLALCSFLMAFAHANLGFTTAAPILMFILLGICYAIYGVVIWPLVSTVAQHQEIVVFRTTGSHQSLVGLAFGIATSALNTGLTIIPLIVASIRVQFGSFAYLEGFFVSLCGTALLCCSALHASDKSGILQNTNQTLKRTCSDERFSFANGIELSVLQKRGQILN